MLNDLVLNISFVMIGKHGLPLELDQVGLLAQSYRTTTAECVSRREFLVISYDVPLRHVFIECGLF